MTNVNNITKGVIIKAENLGYPELIPNTHSAHIFIGPSSTIPHNNAQDRTINHSRGSANKTHIAISLSIPTLSKDDIGEKAQYATHIHQQLINTLVELCEIHDLDPLGENVILSQSEARKNGLAASGVEPEKMFEELGAPITMDDIRNMVATKLSEQIKSNAPAAAEYTPSEEEFYIRSQHGRTNIRETPDTKGLIVGQLGMVRTVATDYNEHWYQIGEDQFVYKTAAIKETNV